MTMRTELTLTHVLPDGEEVAKVYVRPGRIEVQEQLTSWSRECAVDFWGKVRAAEKEPAC